MLIRGTVVKVEFNAREKRAMEATHKAFNAAYKAKPTAKEAVDNMRRFGTAFRNAKKNGLKLRR